MRLVAVISLACCQANTSAAMITPTSTATARSVTMVTAVTATITSASALGTLPSACTLPQAKVLAETTNITPTRAASGMRSISAEPNRIKLSRPSPATMPESRWVAPAPTLIMLWPIITQPPMPPKNPVTTLAAPCARHSRLGMPRVSVIASIRFKVSSDSIKPTVAMITA